MNRARLQQMIQKRKSESEMLSSLDQQLVKLKNPAEYSPANLLAYSEALEKYQADAQQQAQLLAAMASQAGRKINDQDNLMAILNQSVHGQFLDCLDDFTKLQQKFQAFLSKSGKKSSSSSSPAIVVAAAAPASAPAANGSAANGASPDASGDKKKKKKKNKNKNKAAAAGGAAAAAGAKPEAGVDGKEKEKSPMEQKEQKQQAVADSNQK